MTKTVFVPRDAGGRWEVTQMGNDGNVWYRPEGADPKYWRQLSGHFGKRVMEVYGS